MFPPRKNESAPSASALRSLAIDLGPEGHKVVDSRDDGHANHEPNRQPSNQIDGKNERTELPPKPTMVENCRDHADDLHHHLQLSQVACLNGKSFRGGNASE